MEKTLKSKPSRERVSKAAVQVVPVDSVESGKTSGGVFVSAIQLTNTPDMLLAAAIQNPNFNPAALEKLMDLQDRWIKRIAEEKFRDAMAKLQEEIPEIKKTKKVSYLNKTGGETTYFYAPLAEIEKTIKPFMGKHGFSKDFTFENFLDENKNEKIRVTCEITHVAGHKVQNSMTSSADNSGGKNRIQQDGSAIEYMKRYTLTGALGLTTADDDDGRGAGNDKTPKQPNKPTPSAPQFEKMLAQIKTGELTMEKAKQHFDLSPVMEEEIKKSMPVQKQMVDESVLKILINQVRGGLTLEEVKNKFNLSESQEKVLETVINSKRV